MIKLVEQFLSKYDLLNKEKILMVGFSGGADSTCLADILHKLSLSHGFKLFACHLNHNWRGEESFKDMGFCKKFSYERNIEFISENLSKEEKQTETTARELRYDFFEKCIKKYNIDGFFLGHNKNDNAETLIYRIIKGTGIKGLCSIPEKRDKFFRPLLNVERKVIENYCKENNLEHITDSTNLENKYSRNYIRNEILPKFEKINKDYLNSFHILSNIACDNESLISEYLKSVHKNIYNENKIVTEAFVKLSDALKQRIILDLYIKNNLDYSSKRINETIEFIEMNSQIQSGKNFSLSTNLWLFVSKEYIEIIQKKEKLTEEIKINKEGIYNFSDYIFEIKEFNGTESLNFPNETSLKAYVEINEPIDFTLRTRRNGDIIQPLGMNGKMKLKKYLNAKKIKNHNKDELILLCKNNEIYWAPLYGLNEKIKVVKKTTHVLSLKKKALKYVRFKRKRFKGFADK